ncbi:MAG: substrate-binding domain-containing protein, partial [Phycisphaeraceae bacterium JB051]
DDIHSGKLSPGQPLPSIRQLVASNKLALGTVVKGIDLLEEKGLITKHPQRGCFVADRSEAIQESGLVAFVTPALSQETNETSAGIAQGLSQNRKLTLSTFSSHADLDEYASLVNRVLAMQPAGLVLEVLPDSLVQLDYDMIQRSGVPTVLVGTSSQGAGRFDIVNSAHLHKTQVIVEHLLASGAKQLRYLFVSANVTAGYDHVLQALKLAVTGAGLTWEDEHLIVCNSQPGYSRTPDPFIGAQRTMEAYLAENDSFDALICDHDYPAVGAIRAMRQKQVSIPEHVKVVSLARNMPDYGLNQTLTTIDNQRDQLGVMAARVLLQRMADRNKRPETHYWPGKLLIGQTSAADRSC